MIFGLPQALTGSEMVTVWQDQNGQLAKCSMPLSTLLSWVSGNEFQSLPTVLPSQPGVAWNNGGMICLS